MTESDRAPLAVLRDDTMSVVQVHPSFLQPLLEGEGQVFPETKAGLRVKITVPGREGVGTLVPPPWEQAQ